MTLNILIVVATHFEIQPLVDKLVINQKISDRLNSYSFKNLTVDILVTGIGPVATTYHMLKTLNNRKYDLLINLGIAGSFTFELRIGEVVNVKEDQFTDLGIEDGTEFYTLFDKGFMDKNELPFRDGIIRNPTEILSPAYNKLIKVLGSTANTAHSDPKVVERLKDNFCLDTESMEGAAFFYVSNLEGAACIQVRSISNYVAPREDRQWDAEKAITNMAETMVKILDDLNLDN